MSEKKSKINLYEVVSRVILEHLKITEKRQPNKPRENVNVQNTDFAIFFGSD
jgi:hypothetical protein